MKSVIILILTTVLLACNNKNDNRAGQTATETQITDWVRPAVKGGMSGAYFVYVNRLDIPDTVASISTEAARMAQLHETYIAENEMMGMQELKDIILAPGDSLTLKEGDKHLMMMNLTRNLAEGDSITVILTMKQAGPVNLVIPVRNFD